MDILQNIFRAIMFFLDNVVYGLIPEIYKVFIFLSELNLYSTDETNPLYQLVSHVYVLLGIFMLFKVSFSLLQYLVDPNAFRDSSKGIGKLVTNVLVALVLLVSVPYIFSAAMELQSTIVQENVIGQLILGRNASDDSDGLSLEKVDAMAKDLQFMLYGTFYRVNTDVIGECAGTSGVFGSKDTATYNDGGCLEALNQFVSSDDNASANGVTLYSFYKYAPAENDQGNCVGNVCDDRKFNDFGSLLYGKEDGQYVINYMPFISAAAGIYVVFLLISFTIDIAVRAKKLCFLQMVAPIAIVSYIDPKESIGSGKLNNWIKECASTYFSLFLRLATIFFVMLLIEMISSSILADGNYISGQIHEAGDYSIWIYLFLVIGAFMFAKQVPKMIESIFGIKGSGELNLNPFKNAGMVTLGAVGATAGAAIGGAALGGIGNTAANLMKNRDLKQKLAEGKITQEQFDKQYRGRGALIGSAIGGISSGAVRSAVAGAKTKRPISAISTGVKSSSDSRRARAAGYGFVQNAKDKFVEIAGIESDMGTTDAVKSKIKELRNMMSNAQRDEAAASYQMQDLMTRDPNISSSMREAFSEKEQNGELKLKYGTYNDFLKSNIEQYGGSDAKQLFDEVNARMQSKIDNGEDITTELKEIDALVDNINMGGKKVLNRQDYDNYGSAKKARDDADALAKKYEKEISQLEETKGFVRHVGGGKK